MITASPHAAQPAGDGADWRRLWRDAITEGRELLDLLDLGHLRRRLPTDDAGFALRVPRGFAARMRRGDPDDPLLLQVLPQLAEQADVAGFASDAVGDLGARAAHGVLHKYHGRVLLIASGTCAINCRYCFRRHFPYADEIAAAGQWREALDYLRGHPEVDELILSGGDPLALSNAKLRDLTAALPHGALRRLRIHTRLPVVLPERVDAGLLDWLRALPLRVVVVVHANHCNELDGSVADACRRLREAGATLLNQSVLLRGINDSAAALAALSRRLFDDCGVLPYYLHQLDRVRGTAHFEVDDVRARALVEALRGELPGYLVPRLVRELPGEPAKTPL
ncbi:MAG TPA: EF-P beta-lysylation protein EpmB [Rhodanobacteraceae bacterium]|nr:EF-P beta-lysylation protein EpmB [Rhodanobacteraceae bacterium]